MLSNKRTFIFIAERGTYSLCPYSALQTAAGYGAIPTDRKFIGPNFGAKRTLIFIAVDEDKVCVHAMG